jgi:hypothetical protein
MTLLTLLAMFLLSCPKPLFSRLLRERFLRRVLHFRGRVLEAS